MATAHTSETVPDLLGVLRTRKAQARIVAETYGPAVPFAEDTMLHWLARAASEARRAADRKQVHIAASADMDQSSMFRFEQAKGWPRDPDKVIAAYADDLDVDPFQLWEQALRMWRDYREGSMTERVIGLAAGVAHGEPESEEDETTPATRRNRRRRSAG